MQEVCRSSRLVTALLLRFAGDQWGSIALFLPDYKHLSVVDKSDFWRGYMVAYIAGIY